MTDSNPIYTPMDSKVKLVPNKEQASKQDIKLFQAIIGCLLYIVLGTRPNITYSVIKLARYALNPSKDHFIASKRILRYLKATIEYSITYTNSTPFISGFCDSDYVGDIYTAKSTTGYIFYLGEGPISWKSKLQPIVAQSTTEAEYIAINTAAREAVYIIALVKELGFYKQTKFPLYTNNIIN